MRGCDGRTVVFAITLLLSPSAVAQLAIAQNYNNPVANADVPRPFVLKEGSTYYAFAGKTRIPVRTSTDLASWGSASDTLTSPGAWASGWGDMQSAAVAKFGTTWVMYYAAKSSTENRQCIGVATATSPGGPYTAQSTPLVCNPGSGFLGAQDPAVFISGSLGGPAAQLVWVGLSVLSGTPTMILSRPLATNGLSFASGSTTSTLLTPLAEGWEGGKVGSPTVVYDPSTADSTFAKVYLFYSGNAETAVSNSMNWATCGTVSSSDGTLASCRREILGTWMEGITDASAPGDASIFSDGANLWLAYSAYAGNCNSSGVCSGTRKLRVDKLCFLEGFPRTNGPTVSTSVSLSRNSSCGMDIQAPSGSPSLSSSQEELIQVAAPDTVRDDGVSGLVGEDSVWNFGDTTGGFFPCFFDRDGDSVINDPDDSMCSNSAAIANVPESSGEVPLTVSDYPLSRPTLWIPYTADEIADSQFTASYRIVHWPSAFQSRSDGTALVYYERLYVQLDPTVVFAPVGDTCTGVACISLDGSCPIPNTSDFADVSRLGEIFDCDETLFKSGAVVRGGYVYMFGHLTGTTDHGVARVPLGQEANRSSYEFYTGPGGSEWSTDIEEAVATGLVVGGTVAFNPYLGKYLAVGQVPDELGLKPVGDPDDKQYFTLQTAAHPKGPWSSPVQLQVPTRSTFWNNYAMMDHPELAMQRGKLLNVSYYHSGRLRSARITFP